MTPLNWDLCRTFLAVLTEGSLSGAARALGITQPTVGRHIASLEAVLGQTLFTRSQTGLLPTDAAASLRPHAQAMQHTAQAFERAAASLNEEFGAVDILVANAGISYESDTAGHSDEDWRRCMAINLDGIFYCVRSFGKRMVERKRGSIVCISSIAGVKAVRPELHAGYDVSKAGVAHLCRVVGVEWAPHNVRVNAVGPGYTETEMLKKVGAAQPAVMATWIGDTPMKRLLQPAEIAASVAFLASDAASGITGHVLMTDAGYSVA